MLDTSLIETPNTRRATQAERANTRAPRVFAHDKIPNQELLRRVAWEIGAGQCAGKHLPAGNHVALAVVSPQEGYAHWRVLPAWFEQAAQSRGNAWHGSRNVLRLYDVTSIIFDGLNAHHIQDIPLGQIEGHALFKLPRAGTTQLAEAGVLLRSGEFIPAARSLALRFPPAGISPRSDRSALLVDENLRAEAVADVWEHERVLAERRKPKVRRSLRIAALAFQAQACGDAGPLAQFVSELSAGQRALGHEVHVLLPTSNQFSRTREVNGVVYHPLDVALHGSPLEIAARFGESVQRKLRELPRIELFHQHEWMTGMVPMAGIPAIVSLTSIEATRLNGATPGALSCEIRQAERHVVCKAKCILVPERLRGTVVDAYAAEPSRVHAFPMEGRILNEWEQPMDAGQVKMSAGMGPLDRVLLFVGPLEHAAGVDLLVEALPVVLKRAPNARVAFVGNGGMSARLQSRAGELGVAHAVRCLGHLDGPPLTRLIRASEALVLPSRGRVAFDDAVVDLARRGGKPVVTTHSGPAQRVRHEEDGIVTYDNPGSLVWALDRVLGDGCHAQRMGRNGLARTEQGASWPEVVRAYMDICAATFPEFAAP